MFKKFICVIFSVILLLQLPALALKTDSEFSVYGEDSEDVANILDISVSELESYCEENSITYLAVNNENTKQIRLTKTETDFSNKVGNLSHLGDDTILTLAQESLIPDGVMGQVVTKGEQKFIKIEAQTSDSGGEFILTEYITAADKKLYTLSFYTAVGEDTDYIDDVFLTFSEDGFYTETESESRSPYEYVIFAAIILLAVAVVFIIITIIKDIKKPNA